MEKHKNELKKLREEKQRKESRMEKKRKMEKHWEMLRWLVALMEDNESRWIEMKIERDREKREREKEDQWAMKDRAENVREMAKEEELVRAEAKNNKVARYREAARLKWTWRE